MQVNTAQICMIISMKRTKEIRQSCMIISKQIKPIIYFKEQRILLFAVLEYFNHKKNLFILVGMDSNQFILDKIRNDEDYISTIYSSHRTYVFNYFSKYWHVDTEHIADLYQDALIVFLEKSRNPSFQLTCNIQTYLNSIISNKLKSKHKSKVLDPIGDFDETIKDELEEYDDVKEERIHIIEKKLEVLKKDGGRCYELLRRFFYLKHSFNRIAEEMEYTNAENAKHQKARCQKRLKQMVLN